MNIRPALPAIILVVLLRVLTSANESTVKTSHHSFRMKNGIRVFLKTKPGIPLTNIVLAVNIGSKDESEPYGGWVHLMEHLLMFSGTRSRSSPDYIRMWRKNGCLVNAHTDHDLMTLEMSFPTRNSEICLQLLKEKVFELKPGANRLTGEKQVIAQEINLLQDNELRQASDLVLNMLFPKHAYGKPVYGDPSTIEQAKQDRIMSEYEHYFRPDNCSLAVVGNFNPNEMKQKIIRIFRNAGSSAGPSSPLSKPGRFNRNQTETRQMDIEQAVLAIGFRAPEFNHRDQFAMTVLTHILGKGPNPLLGLAIRSRKKMIASYSTQYIKRKYGGALLIYFRTDPNTVKLLKRRVMKFLNRTNTYRYSKDDFPDKDRIRITGYLGSAHNEIRLNSEEFKERGLNSAMSFARFMLLKNPGETFDYRKEMEAITAADLRRVASKYICGKPHAIAIVLPMSKNENK
jgi:zinc protease